MSNKNRAFGDTIPELKETITKFGCKLNDSPPYVIVGQYKSQSRGTVMGILAASQNQFHAHIIRREVNKNGKAEVYQTEYHSSPTFSIETYKQGIREKMEEKELANKKSI